MRWFFGFFLVSGFCSILYEIVWLRLAMAQFGVTTALVSIVLSMFMAGLGLGSWGGGRLIRQYAGRVPVSALHLYGLTELLIGVSAFLVPFELRSGRILIEHAGLSSSWTYSVASGIWIALTLVPWCACMGATIPIAMLAIGNTFRRETPRSFSFLYLANVLGAVLGATVPLVLIELYGFHGTLRIGATFNGLLAVSALALRLRPDAEDRAHFPEYPGVDTTAGTSGRSAWLLALLFITGLTSMGMEVVWIRQFTPYLGTVVYAFASILSTYLLSTFIGSRFYRFWSRNHTQEGRLIWGLLGLFALLPLITADPQIHLSKGLRLILGVVPFSAMLGFVTPMLIDRWSAGDPDRAGSAYAVNVVGCILGPLLAGFLLLPLMSERWVLFLFALPWLALSGRPGRSSETGQVKRQAGWQTALSYAATPLALVVLFAGKGYEDQFAHHQVLRDNTATVVATGEGMRKRLLVNGYGITELTPETKVMAHLPLAFLDHAPQSTLVVCFGMGTTYRSLLSWEIPTTAVELVPSVPRLFWYYHADASELLRSPLSRVVIDDGRRYLERTSEQYDVITIDPPPPVEAAGSSLLYSKEFYSIVKMRLRPGGILQQWLPYGDAVVQASFAHALQQSFPYVRIFRALTGTPKNPGGFHFLASTRPIPGRTAAELANRTPAAATRDYVEWGPEATVEKQFAILLQSEMPLDQMLAEAPLAPALGDDQPMNEYYVVRRRLLP